MNIVLIGMRGSGKTTVSKILGDKLKRDVIETDDLVVKKAKLTIPEIVEKHGWDYFRNLESEIAQEISKLNNKIISTGGGIVVKEENIKALKENGIIFWLDADTTTILKRIGKDPNRPALTNNKSLEDEMELILKKRNQMYKKAANELIYTQDLKPDEVADKILLKLNKYEN